MDKIADHVGMYDIWTMLFPGAVGVLESLLFARAINGVISGDDFAKIMNFIPDTVSEWILLIVLSIFCGLIFQEIGRILRKLFKLKKATKDIFNIENGLFEEKEIDLFKTEMKEGEWDEENAFRMINAEAQEKGIASRYIKLNVIQNMSLSLASVMLVGTVEAMIVLVFSIFSGAKDMLITSGITIPLCIFLLIMFIKRSTRFGCYWVRNLVYAIMVSRLRDKNGDRELHEKP